LHFSLYPLPHSPRRVLPSTTAPRSSDGYHVDGATYWSMDNNIASGVTAEKNIAGYRYYPIHANIAQYPITQ